MTEFDQLPNEVVFQVLQFLDATSLVKLGATCKRLQELTRVGSLWETLCRQKFGLTTTEGWGENTTFYDIYSQVLHDYGFSLGLWRNSASSYGTCVHIKFENAEICARFLVHPKTENVNEDLMWSEPLFKVTLKDGKGKVICRKGCPSPSLSSKTAEGNLVYKCDRCLTEVLNKGDDELFTSWLMENEMNLGHPDYIFKCFTVAVKTKQWSDFSLQAIPPSVQSPGTPIHLGMYKGTYGSHGIEIIRLSLSNNGYELHGDKILGDPNVPAGKISLYIDLRMPMTLTREQQEDFDFLSHSLNPENVPAPLPAAFRFPPTTSQPFHLSDNIFMRSANQLPSVCQARYFGKGQIAGAGFKDPEFCPGHFVVFSEDYFGFLWLGLTSFSEYKLVPDDFS